jgi:hypothetical protein
MALGQIIETNAINGNALQIDHTMTKQLSHPSNLAVAAFFELNFQ